MGFKSIAAYRTGLDLDPARPSDREVAAAAASWIGRPDDGPIPRLVDRTLIRFLVWTALDLGRPLQFHVGYGDADADLRQGDPLLLTPLLRATASRGAPIMLLHNYPFHRSRSRPRNEGGGGGGGDESHHHEQNDDDGVAWQGGGGGGGGGGPGATTRQEEEREREGEEEEEEEEEARSRRRRQ